MSRHFERRISLAITRRLASTRITPNAMTLVSLAVGLGSAPFFLSRRPAGSSRGAHLPHPLDPRRLRRRAGPAQVPGVPSRRPCSTSGATTSCTSRCSAAWRWAGACRRTPLACWASARSRSPPRWRRHRASRGAPATPGRAAASSTPWPTATSSTSSSCSARAGGLVPGPRGHGHTDLRPAGPAPPPALAGATGAPRGAAGP